MQNYLFLNMAVCHAISKDDQDVFFKYIRELKNMQTIEAKKTYKILTNSAEDEKMELNGNYFIYYREQVFLMKEDTRDLMNLALKTSLQ